MRLKNFYPALILLFFILSAWQAYVSLGFISQRVLPAPSTIIKSIINSREILLEHTLVTTTEILAGFIISIIFAVLISAVIFLSPVMKKAVYPHLVASQTIPIIALAPLLLIWFGFGMAPKIIIIVIYSFFPIAVALSDGLASTPKHLVDYMKSLGASKLQILMHVNFPSALGKFFIGLKIGAVYAVTGAIVGEFVGARQGLGLYLQTSAYSHATAQVFAAIAITMLLAFTMLLIIAAAQKIVMPWRNLGRNE